MKKLFLFSVSFLFLIGRGASVSATEYTNSGSAYDANAEYFRNSNALTAIGADKAYTKTGSYDGYSGNGVTVAIIDSGTQLNHEDLKEKISLLKQDNFNQIVDDHGTHVAGIVAAEKNGFDGSIHGVAYGASVLPFAVFCDEAPSTCMSGEDAWSVLLGSNFADVKIINNSWGAGLSEEREDEILSLTRSLVANGKLLISSAGNDMALSPGEYPAGLPSRDSSLQAGMISVVAYDPSKLPSNDHFIAGYSNLALGAQKWTLAAPGTFVSSISYNTDDVDPNKYDTADGTSMAAPVVSGVAALVQEAFPYMSGKQIADVLFSTAFKKEDLPTLSQYLIQEDEGKKRFLYFYEGEEPITDEALTAYAAGKGFTCSETDTCHVVTFEDVFGQGLVNAGDAVKGPKYFDFERLTASDYDTSLGQYFYTVDTGDKDSTWSNDITQKINTVEGTDYYNKNIGLRKKGTSILTLAGNNDFKGTSSVEEGVLALSGSLDAPVDVNGGTFRIAGGTMEKAVTVNNGTFDMATGTMNGNVKVNSGSSFTMDGGTLNGETVNEGTVVAGDGLATEAIVNSGTFKVSNHMVGDTAVQGTFQTTAAFTNNRVFEFAEKGRFKGDLDNRSLIRVTGDSKLQGQINNAAAGKMNVEAGKTLEIETGTIENDGVLTGFGTVSGTVNNSQTGSVGTSLIINGTLNSEGNIMLESEGRNPKALTVDTLNITGGKLAVSPENMSYHKGQTYTIINANTLVFTGFEPYTKLSDFVVATPVRVGNRIDMEIDFLPVGDTTASFLTEERDVAKVFDHMYMDQNHADFNRFYYYTADELKEQINLLRSKVQPVQSEQLPLNKVMAGQVYAHLFSTGMIENASEVRHRFVPMQQYQGRYYRGRSGGDSSTSQKVWGQFLGGIVKEDGNSSLKQRDMTTRSVGMMFGYDYDFSESFLFGVTAGVASAKLKQDNTQIDLRDYRAGFYTASRFGRVTLNTVTMGGFQKYNSERVLPLVGMNVTNKAKFNGYSAEFDANIGYDFMRVPYRDYSFYLRSYLSANVNYIHQDAYKEENNSFLALGVNEMHDTSVSVSPGVTLGYMFSRASVTADFSYQRIVSGGSLHSTAYFLADEAKTPFSSLSSDTDKDFFNFSLGLKTKLTHKLHLNMSAGTRISDKTKALNFSAMMSYNF